MVRDQYVKELNAGEMVGWAIRGLYRRVEAKMPAGDQGTARQGQGHAAAASWKPCWPTPAKNLGKREDLESNKDVDLSLADDDVATWTRTRSTSTSDQARRRVEAAGPVPRASASRFAGLAAKDALLVVSPIKGSPAYRAGLKAGDLITQIETDRDDKGKQLPRPEGLLDPGHEDGNGRQAHPRAGRHQGEGLRSSARA